MTVANYEPENLFGKAHGRFDEALAHRAIQRQPERALSACAAMDETQFAAFIALFNRVFDTKHRAGFRIVANQEPKP